MFRKPEGGYRVYLNRGGEGARGDIYVLALTKINKLKTLKLVSIYKRE